MAVKSVSIRIEEEMLKKIAYIADYEYPCACTQCNQGLRERARDD